VLGSIGIKNKGRSEQQSWIMIKRGSFQKSSEVTPYLSAKAAPIKGAMN